MRRIYCWLFGCVGCVWDSVRVLCVRVQPQSAGDDPEASNDELRTKST